MTPYEAAIIAKLRFNGCELKNELTTVFSFAFVYDGFLFFVPRPNGDVFTSEQLEKIESAIAFLEIELLPLDPWLH